MDCEYSLEEKVQNLNELVMKDSFQNQYLQQRTNQTYPSMEEQIHHLSQSYSEINDLCDALNDLNFHAKERQEQVERDLQFATEHRSSELISLGPDILSQVMTYMDEDGLSVCQEASRTLKERVITQEHWQYLTDLSTKNNLFPLTHQDPVIRRQQQFMHQWLLQSSQNQRAASQ